MSREQQVILLAGGESGAAAGGDGRSCVSACLPAGGGRKRFDRVLVVLALEVGSARAHGSPAPLIPRQIRYRGAAVAAHFVGPCQRSTE